MEVWKSPELRLLQGLDRHPEARRLQACRPSTQGNNAARARLGPAGALRLVPHGPDRRLCDRGPCAGARDPPPAGREARRGRHRRARHADRFAGHGRSRIRRSRATPTMCCWSPRRQQPRLCKLQSLTGDSRNEELDHRRRAGAGLAGRACPGLRGRGAQDREGAGQDHAAPWRAQGAGHAADDDGLSRQERGACSTARRRRQGEVRRRPRSVATTPSPRSARHSKRRGARVAPATPAALRGPLPCASRGGDACRATP